MLSHGKNTVKYHGQQTQIPDQQVQHLKNHLASASKFLSERGNKPDIEMTSMPILSKKLWLQKKKLMLIAARPSNHKSSFSLNLCWDAAKTKNVIYLSLEQSVEEAIERLFCIHMKIDNITLLKGGFDKFQKEWIEFEQEVSRRHLIMTEGIGSNWEQVEELIDGFAEQGIDMILLDYIGCISSRGQTMKESIDEFVRHFRKSAIENNYLAVLCAQINRAGVSKDGSVVLPDLTHIKESGSLEEHCDKCLILHWDFHYKPKDENINNFLINIAKNKSGRTGIVRAKVFPQWYRFEDTEIEPKDITKKVEEVRKNFGGKFTNVYKG